MNGFFKALLLLYKDRFHWKMRTKDLSLKDQAYLDNPFSGYLFMAWNLLKDESLMSFMNWMHHCS